MNRQLSIRKLLFVIIFAGTITTWVCGQTSSIELEEALRIASMNYVGLERDRLFVEQQRQLAGAGLPAQPTQLFFSGEEFNLEGQTGVQSFNIQQNFYLPQVAKTQRAYYQQGVAVAEKQLVLTGQELKLQVTQAYYRLQYARQEQVLAAENLTLYKDFLKVATTQLESGETGKIPQLTARSRIGKAQLKQDHADLNYQIALMRFNQWLSSDTLYDAEGDLPRVPRNLVDSNLIANPHLQVIQARQKLAAARVETQKSQMLPQINSGLRLQNAFGDFPLFGYQVGINIPLFRNAYHSRIDAARVGVKVQEAAYDAEKQELNRETSSLRYRIDHQLYILKYLEEELFPVIDEQVNVNLQAYQEGAIGYLEYLDTLEQLTEVNYQYLSALYQFNALQAELDYWLGN